MARVAGVDIPDNKRAIISLTYIFGVGKSTAAEVLKKAGVSEDVKVKELEEAKLDEIRNLLEEYQTEGELRTKVRMDIKRLMDIGSYRGERHKRRLPLRGQKTKTNAKTSKNVKDCFKKL
ncbi:30S ribosomal protein S13 [Chitinivibrio alkaliphilus]|uniref:Small ribosomal subunit protein uS13 n=1 Tax=Chitinivibrio alkaliphilus ACht1 TaxID=1313304 RepID=U7DA46_9BACT|nr:30S ribosomal protein S13 [Chitinivibrio alkaliphilus]ERP31310.1 30S ribosomal protein S13 [Chitinivibrio alkaliphilus ACht1]